MNLIKPPNASPERSATRSGQSGFTIIEVLVAALVLAVVAAGAATAFAGAIGTSGLARNQSAAQALAQQDENKLRGETVGELSNLNQTLAPVTIDGTTYSVHESAQFVSDSAGMPSCTNPSADYLETTSTVTWNGMPSSLRPVSVTGLITPTASEIDSNGVLAVDVEDQTGAPLAGMNVSAAEVNGPGSASGVTASNGCVLFANLPPGSDYTVKVSPPSGTYVDGTTDQPVTPGSPDTQTNVSVSAGTTAATPKPIVLAIPGTATFSFSDLFPTGVSPSAAYAPTATSPSVILVASSELSSYLACSAQDTSGCPSTTNPDTSWTASAWNGASGEVVAKPLAPYTYETYAGICPNDDPTRYGGAEVPVTVTSGQTTSVSPSISLPSMVVRLYSGRGTPTVSPVATPPVGAGREMALPTGAELVVTDVGCGEAYVGGPGVSVPSGASYLPISSSPILDGSANDTGLLAYPGMPDGQYTVCYQLGADSAETSPSFVNSGNGEVINLFNGSLSPGTCKT